MQRISNKKNYIPNVEIKNYVMNDGKKFFDQPIKDNNKHIITYENIGKITTSQGDYYTMGCFFGYIYFKNH